VDPHQHWEAIYSTRDEGDVSWHESVPAVSLRLLEAAGLTNKTCVLDVGGGDSRLIDVLVTRGMTCLAVLDISESALHRARARLGDAARIPTWIATDVTGEVTIAPVDVWHDRALFHFLMEPRDRAAYIANLRRILKPGGTAIIATFALDGPETCSGLPVRRYSPDTLAAELSEEFELVESVSHAHTTPRATTQAFQYSRFVRETTRQL